MSFESDLRALILPITTRCYPDVTPDVATFPLSVYQQVGGQAYAYVEKKLPDHKHARIQVTIWADSRLDADVMARSVEKAIIESDFTAEAYGAFVALYEPAIKKYGTRQDFGIWYPDPEPPTST